MCSCSPPIPLAWGHSWRSVDAFSPGVKRGLLRSVRQYLHPACCPAGLLEVRSDFVVEDSGLADEVCPAAQQWDVGSLPGEFSLFFWLVAIATRKAVELAWSLFGGIQDGWRRAQAICDYSHDRIEFGYHHARGDRTASEGHEEAPRRLPGLRSSCADLSRCMNIPARYCNGYLGDIGVPIDPAPMDFQRMVRSVP